MASRFSVVGPGPPVAGVRPVSRRKMAPPVGKSGPRTISVSSSMLASGLSMRWAMASHSSPRLCGGMFEAIPTAMPEAPLASRLGRRAGSTRGSFKEASKFGAKSPGLRWAPLRRLPPVADVRQRARHDHGHGVVQIGGAHLLLYLDGAHVAQRE